MVTEKCVVSVYEEALRILEALHEHRRWMIREAVKEMDSQVLPRAPIRLEVELAD